MESTFSKKMVDLDEEQIKSALGNKNFFLAGKKAEILCFYCGRLLLFVCIFIFPDFSTIYCFRKDGLYMTMYTNNDALLDDLQEISRFCQNLFKTSKNIYVYTLK